MKSSPKKSDYIDMIQIPVKIVMAWAKFVSSHTKLLLD